MVTASIFRSSLLYAGFLAVMAVIDVFAGPPTSSVLPVSLLTTGVLVAAFGYGAASGQTVAQVALVLLGLGPLLRFGLQAAEGGIRAWTTLGLLIRALAAGGGLALSSLAVRKMLNESSTSHDVAPPG